MHLIYLYSDPRTLIPRYVGKGSSVATAFRHLKKCHNRGLRKLIAECPGIQPEMFCTGIANDNSASAIERFWISVFGRADLKKGSLFNLTDGGEGTFGFSVPWSEEKREKQRISQKKAAANKTAEQKEAYWKSMSAALKGKSHATIICPHCGKEGSKGLFTRWKHIDNCKRKP